MCLTHTEVIAQSDTKGKEFWVSLFRLSSKDSTARGLQDDAAYLHFAATTNTKITISKPFRRSETPIATLNIEPGITTYEIPGNLLKELVPTDDGVNEGRALKIISTNAISAYLSQYERYGQEATHLSPVESAGYKFTSGIYYENLGIAPPFIRPDPSTIHVVNVKEHTFLSVQLDINDGTFTKQEEILVYLRHPGEVYKLDLRDIYNVEIKTFSDINRWNTDVRDTTGGATIDPSAVNIDPTINYECNPVLVYSGSQNRAPEFCPVTHVRGSVIFDAVEPSPATGKEYVLLPFAGRETQNFVSMITFSEQSARYTIYRSDSIPIVDSVDFFRNTFRKFFDFSEKAVYVKADNPIHITQLSYVQDICEQEATPIGEGYGSPFSYVMPPLEQAFQKADIPIIPHQDIERYYLGLVIRTSAISSFKMSPAPLEPINFEPVVNAPWSYANIRVEEGEIYSIETSGEDMVVTEYGFGLGESFGMVPYRNVKNLGLDFTSEDAQIGITENDVCIDTPVMFNLDYLVDGQENVYTDVEWDFGDNTFASGPIVQKTFTESGNYRIRVTARDSTKDCSDIQEFTKRIEVQEIVAERILGPISLCPNTDGIEYSIEKDDKSYTYEWSVTGGEISGSNTDETVIIDWKEASADTKVEVTLRNAFGCEIGEPLVLEVSLDPLGNLSPEIPFGNVEVCATDKLNQTYWVPPINDALFEWEVIGGTILSGQNENEIEVSWEQPNGSVKYTLFLSADKTSCFGDSPPLEVTIYSELESNLQVFNPSCAGVINGQARVTASGGKPPYTIEWSNGEIDEPFVRLTEGDYWVQITDAMNCVSIDTFNIAAPDPLTFIAEVTDLNCNGAANGVIDILARGGTGNYSYNIFSENGTSVTTDNPRITGLNAGTYSITVNDANACSYSEQVILVEPEPMNVETVLNDPVCSGETADIVLDVSGGVGPYSFSWGGMNNTTSVLRDVPAGDYSVSVRDANGCVVQLTITKAEALARMRMPNAFSPNGDGVNDILLPIYSCVTGFKLTIYNRWGELAFQGDDFEGWNGVNTQGQPSDPGVYSYFLQFTGVSSGNPYSRSLRGSVLLAK